MPLVDLEKRDTMTAQTTVEANYHSCYTQFLGFRCPTGQAKRKYHVISTKREFSVKLRKIATVTQKIPFETLFSN